MACRKQVDLRDPHIQSGNCAAKKHPTFNMSMGLSQHDIHKNCNSVGEAWGCGKFSDMPTNPQLSGICGQ